jgi:hypothetical protein
MRKKVTLFSVLDPKLFFSELDPDFALILEPDWNPACFIKKIYKTLLLGRFRNFACTDFRSFFSSIYSV